MNKIKIFVLLLLASTNLLQAQSSDNKVLFNINGEEVYVDEFLESYNRNLDLISDPEQKKLSVNLELYKSYRAKLQQARKLGLDTLPVYLEEINKYRKQLSESYFNDPIEEEKLVKEAYERSKYELNVSHILILVKQDASKSEKKKALDKLNSISEEINSGKISFDQAAKKYSEDPSAVKNSGRLNWMSVFYMVYPFETGAYNLEVGEVSKAVETQYGYHLIKLNEKRESKGKVQIAHIIKYYIPGKNRDSLDVAYKSLLDTIAIQVKDGKKFGDLARRYSDDKRTGMNGGNIPPLGSGKLFPQMEQFAFNTEEGEMSPAFKSKYGWHILMVNKKYPISSYEDSKEQLLKEVKSDGRHSIIDKSVLSHLKSKYKIIQNDKNFRSFELKIDSVKLYNPSTIHYSNQSSVVLTIEGEKYLVSDYLEYLVNNPVDSRSKLSVDYRKRTLRDAFIDYSILKYYDLNLEKEFPEFNSVMRNYKEGILVYNLMNEKIWLESYRDTLGLESFYETNKNKYMWPERANVLVAKCFNEDAAKKVKKYLKRSWSQEKIEKKMNKSSDVKVTFQSGVITKENKVIPENFEWSEGVSEIYKKSDNNYVIVDVLNYVEPQVKSFEEAENMIRSDYQTLLEDRWAQELKRDYKADLNEEVYKELEENIK